MGLGPVLRYELITTSRRGRYYVLRLAYGLLLLMTLWSQFERERIQIERMQSAWARTVSPRQMQQSARDMAQFAEAAFLSLAWGQWVAMLILVPALTAGVIADAHRRKTLRDLLSSGMSASAIVVGKLAARMVHVATFVALGLPIVALIGLFGGLDPLNVAMVYVGTFSIALAVGGVSILASTLARRPREAILSAYALEIGWLIVPPIMGTLLPYMMWPFPWLVPINGVLVQTHPLDVWNHLSNNSVMMRYGVPGGAGPAPWLATMIAETHSRFLVMAVVQTLLGLACTFAAVKILRPLRAGDADWPWTLANLWGWLRSRSLHRAPRVRTIPARPGCGDQPMLWKERHAIPRGGLAWLTSRPIVLFFGTLLGCWLFDVALPIFRAMLALEGLGHVDAARAELNQVVRMSVGWLFAAWWLAVASAGAVSLTSEREDDTWISLTSTLLSGPEIIRAKVFGAIWGTRRLAYAILAVLAVGVIGLGVHPLGALLALLGMACFGAFAAALGATISLRAKSSTRAMVGTVLVLGATCLVPPYLGTILSEDQIRPGSLGWMVTVVPLLEYGSVLSYGDVSALWNGREFQVAGQMVPYGRGWLAVCLAGMLLNAAAAWVLTEWTSEAFEAVAGRAQWHGQRVRPAPALEG